jgi:plastocyanin
VAKTTRRNLIKVAAAGSVSAALGLTIKPATEAVAVAEPQHDHDKPISGPLAQATVSFGQWSTSPALDRLTVPNPGARNVHQLIPNEVTIQAGGTVNFLIAGFHNVVVYGNGTEPSDIRTNMLLAAPLNFLIDDPRNRIYRGLSPAGVPANFLGTGNPAAAIAAPPQERLESVNFSEPGRYLVICGVLGHFSGGMFGFVRVLP